MFLKNRFFIALCAFMLLATACTQTQEIAQGPPAETAPRAAGPAKVTQIDDAKLKELLKPNGKPLLVNFWATWCGPCREEFPDLVRIDNEYYGKIDFITISLDYIEELETGVPKFLTEMNAQMPTYLLISEDENTVIASVAKNWSGGLPFTILYDPAGTPTFTHQGAITHTALKAEIEKALGE